MAPPTLDTTTLLTTPKPTNPRYRNHIGTEYIVIIIGVVLPVVSVSLYVAYRWARRRHLQIKNEPPEETLGRTMDSGYGMAVIDGVPAAREQVEGGDGDVADVYLGSPVPEMRVVGDHDAVLRRVIEWNGGREEGRTNLRGEAERWVSWARGEGDGEGIEMGEVPRREEEEEGEEDGDEDEDSGDTQGEEEQLPKYEQPPPYSPPRIAPWDTGTRLVDGNVNRQRQRVRER